MPLPVSLLFRHFGFGFVFALIKWMDGSPVRWGSFARMGIATGCVHEFRIFINARIVRRKTCGVGEAIARMTSHPLALFSLLGIGIVDPATVTTTYRIGCGVACGVQRTYEWGRAMLVAGPTQESIESSSSIDAEGPSFQIWYLDATARLGFELIRRPKRLLPSRDDPCHALAAGPLLALFGAIREASVWAFESAATASAFLVNLAVGVLSPHRAGDPAFPSVADASSRDRASVGTCLEACTHTQGFTAAHGWPGQFISSPLFKVVIFFDPYISPNGARPAQHLAGPVVSVRRPGQRRSVRGQGMVRMELATTVWWSTPGQTTAGNRNAPGAAHAGAGIAEARQDNFLALILCFSRAFLVYYWMAVPVGRVSWVSPDGGSLQVTIMRLALLAIRMSSDLLGGHLAFVRC
ncbi:hypothetical protein B0H12DRAFT_1216485 [Mycena haematopus]|nr:hypothetical protein B0H12DRAFT_1216485 [Mycena haematopus]